MCTLLSALLPVLLLLWEGSAATPSTPGQAGSWLDDPSAQHEAFQRIPIVTPLFTVDLDLPPEDRWSLIYADPMFKTAPADLKSYFDANVPAWSVPLLEKIGQDVEGHFHDYGREMRGVARSLGVSLGTIVLVNLVEALEGVAVDCTKANTTGPCPKKDKNKGPGMCTSIVAEAKDGLMWHARNMDWNLPNYLRKYIMDVDFVRSGKPLYRATTVAGMVGALHGLRKGGFSITVDARDQGGSTFLDLLSFVTGRRRTPSHLLREALETKETFEAGVQLLGSNVLIEPVYYIVAGAQPREAAVLACARGRRAVDIWTLNATDAPAPWFLLQTNYDHWRAPPPYDDRTTPGIAHMLAMGQEHISEANLRGVLHQWPTFNHHTDISVVVGTSEGSYTSYVWMDSAQSAHAAEIIV